MCKEFRLHLLLIVALSLAFTGCNSSTSTPHPAAASNTIWIATQDDQMVRSYSIEHTKGSISPIGNGGSPVSTGQRPAAIAVSVDRTNLFVANAGDDTLSVYAIGQDGSLTALGLPIPAGKSPKALAVDPTNNLLFVANQGSDLISVFKLSPGLATFKTSFAIQTPAPSNPSGPVALAVSPAGFPCINNPTHLPLPVIQTCLALYAANQTAGTVTAYVYYVDLSGNFVRGAMDANDPSGTNFVAGGTVPGSPYTVGTFPSALAFSRCAGAGTNPAIPCQSAGVNGLLVTNAASNDVTVFSACIQLPCVPRSDATSSPAGPDGSLTPIHPSVSVGAGPAAVLVDPAADFVYVVDSGSNQISTFSYTTSDGTLTQIGSTNAPGTSVFSGGAITPNFNTDPNTFNWLVITGPQALFAFRSGPGTGGSLSPAGSAQFSGQPSAILVR